MAVMQYVSRITHAVCALLCYFVASIKSTYNPECKIERGRWNNPSGATTTLQAPRQSYNRPVTVFTNMD